MYNNMFYLYGLQIHIFIFPVSQENDHFTIGGYVDALCSTQYVKCIVLCVEYRGARLSRYNTSEMGCDCTLNTFHF